MNCILEIGNASISFTNICITANEVKSCDIFEGVCWACLAGVVQLGIS